MNIFSQIAPTANDVTLRDACQAIAGLATSKQLVVSPWSLAELGADDEDLCWLFDWARGLDGHLIRHWFRSLPHRAAAGSLLLFFAAEYARRALPRESDWYAAPSDFFAASARVELFDGDDPSIAHRQAWLEAARRLRLRHTPAGDDVAGQRELIALQIGYTEAEIQRLLPRWLSGGDLPAAVRALLAPQTGSRTFQVFWQTRAFAKSAWSPENQS